MSKISGYIDHTLLKPDATKEQIIKICDEALKYNFASVCVNSCWTKTVAKRLAGSNVKTCVVTGFPLGAMSTEAKAYETLKAVKDGAEEIDTVINVGKLKSKEYDYVLADLKAVTDAAKGKAIVKVIIETCLLIDDEKVTACELAVKAGADFVKTSTGFSLAGATVADVALMRKTVGPDIGVKAAGGIRTYDAAIEMLKAGASRIGASAGIKMIEEESGK